MLLNRSLCFCALPQFNAQPAFVNPLGATHLANARQVVRHIHVTRACAIASNRSTPVVSPRSEKYLDSSQALCISYMTLCLWMPQRFEDIQQEVERTNDSAEVVGIPVSMGMTSPFTHQLALHTTLDSISMATTVLDRLCQEQPVKDTDTINKGISCACISICHLTTAKKNRHIMSFDGFITREELCDLEDMMETVIDNVTNILWGISIDNYVAVAHNLASLATGIINIQQMMISTKIPILWDINLLQTNLTVTQFRFMAFLASSISAAAANEEHPPAPPPSPLAAPATSSNINQVCTCNFICIICFICLPPCVVSSVCHPALYHLFATLHLHCIICLPHCIVSSVCSPA